jgi:hypothetical protein
MLAAWVHVRALDCVLANSEINDGNDIGNLTIKTLVFFMFFIFSCFLLTKICTHQMKVGASGTVLEHRA